MNEVSNEMRRAVLAAADLAVALRDYESIAQLGMLDAMQASAFLPTAALAHCELEHALTGLGFDGSEFSYPTGPMDSRLKAALQVVYRVVLTLRDAKGEWNGKLPGDSIYTHWMQIGKCPSFERELPVLERAVEMLNGGRSANSEPEADALAPQYVTLDQAAAMVNRTKRTLENYRATMPAPAVEGGGRGMRHEWKWSELRPWLERTFDRDLPEHPYGNRDA